jgi:hypothetical protein
MHVRLIRKHLQPAWSWFSRIAMGVLLIELFLLCGISHADAEGAAPCFHSAALERPRNEIPPGA